MDPHTFSEGNWTLQAYINREGYLFLDVFLFCFWMFFCFCWWLLAFGGFWLLAFVSLLAFGGFSWLLAFVAFLASLASKRCC